MSFNSKNNSVTMPKQTSKIDHVIGNLGLVDRFVKAAEEANKTVIEELARILNEDPKRFLYER